MGVKRIAHRGLSELAPENTDVSFRLAAETDCYGIECDVWKTLDGVYVVSHDNSMKRMFGVRYNITDCEYDELKNYPVISGNQVEDYPVQYLISLRRFLSILSKSEKMAFVELKQEFSLTELEEILQLTKEYGMDERVFFISASAKNVLKLRYELRYPKEKIQYIHGACPRLNMVPVNEKLIQLLIKHKIGIDAKCSLIDEKYVDRMHDEGLIVNVWTVKNKRTYDYVTDALGVDMVTMNDVTAYI
ncbi:MAG: hypothetical protein K5639_07420 [Eubacterium sp.]|nr:hypothetical protein [Eubacterium sp.]